VGLQQYKVLAPLALAEADWDGQAGEADGADEGLAGPVDLQRMARLRSRLPQPVREVLRAQGALPVLAGSDDALLLFQGQPGWAEPYLPPLCSHLVGVATAPLAACGSWLVGEGLHQRPLQRAEVLIIPAGAPAWLQLSEPQHLLWLALRPRQLYGSRRHAAAPLRACAGAADAVLHGLATTLLAAAHGGSPALPALIEHLGRALAAQLLAQHSKRAAPARDSLGRVRLERALAFLDTRMAQPVDLAEAARVAGCSVPHFAHLFKSAMGISPMRYLRQRRMQSARELIETTGLSMGEIGHRVGLPDAARFSQAFRAYWKTSPSALRRQA
jgi:AraC family transcriptional regulator